MIIRDPVDLYSCKATGEEWISEHLSNCFGAKEQDTMMFAIISHHLCQPWKEIWHVSKVIIHFQKWLKRDVKDKEGMNTENFVNLVFGALRNRAVMHRNQDPFRPTKCLMEHLQSGLLFLSHLSPFVLLYQSPKCTSFWPPPATRGGNYNLVIDWFPNLKSLSPPLPLRSGGKVLFNVSYCVAHNPRGMPFWSESRRVFYFR